MDWPVRDQLSMSHERQNAMDTTRLYAQLTVVQHPWRI